MAAKSFNVTIREDGSIVVVTGDMHGEFHTSADQFMLELERLCGSKPEVKSTKGHVHHHNHDHQTHTH